MGWPRDLFFVADEEVEEFKCSICLDVLRKPMKLMCKHIFCHRCIYDWVSSRVCQINILQPTCPLCRKKIHYVYHDKKKSDGTYRLVSTQFNRHISRNFLTRLYSIEMKCINEPKGCNATFLYSELKDHILDDCLFRNVSQVQVISLDTDTY